MTKYLINRIIRSIFSIVIVVGIVMLLIYTGLDRNLVFAKDPQYSKTSNNGRQAYMMQKWEEYGYVDYITYSEWLNAELKAGNIDQETFDAVVKFANKQDNNDELTAEYLQKFFDTYTAQGYDKEYLEGKMQGKTKKYQNGGEPEVYVYKDVPLTTRLVKYFTGLVSVDNIHYASGDVGERGISFTLFDPAYGGEKLSPAIMANGTKYKYLFYMDGNFPFIHQNLVKINLGLSYTVNKGVDVFQTMTQSQGSFAATSITYPTGVVETSADDLHSATYMAGSLASNTLAQKYYDDDYTNVSVMKAGKSKMGYSFSIGICAVLMSYMLAIPLGTVMALKKDKFVDKLGTFYIVFIIAVPSLAYIFLFKAIGGNLGLPTTFDMENPTTLMYVLPIVSLALPSIANLMKWLRSYMIDQMSSDYVKFARSGGLSEGEIFTKHILKNAIIPIVHGIPGSILGAMTGAIITERVYVVPGAGNLLTNAIENYDNGAIVGVTLFYAVLSVTAVILGDILMSVMDPRISFTSKGR